MLGGPLASAAADANTEESSAADAETGAAVEVAQAPAGPGLRRPGFERPGEEPEEATEEEAPPPFRRPGEPPPGEAAAEAERPPPTPIPSPDYEFVTVPDRWRIVEALGVNERWWDPYHQNTLKGDRPILGTQDWFLELSAISDTVVEARRLPTPAGISVTRSSGVLDIFGSDEQLAINQNLILSASLIQRDTTFRPPDYEIRVTGIGNFNYAKVEENGIVRANPKRGRSRSEWDLSLGEAFVDKHLWNKNERYDFDSVRVGIQSFTSDFRGFLFNDANLGARLFGTFANNRIQYNLAYFRRIEKDINSGLAEILDLRKDDVFMANVYYQDFPVLGFTLEGIVAYNRNREGDENPHRDQNDFQQRPAPFGAARPHNYDVGYLGLAGDGHFDRLNLTFASYYAFGHDKENPVSQRSTDIHAFFAAAEASLDFDWYRLKLFGAYASGDDDPTDDHAGGFDAIFENPNFAGADTS